MDYICPSGCSPKHEYVSELVSFNVKEDIFEVSLQISVDSSDGRERKCGFIVSSLLAKPRPKIIQCYLLTEQTAVHVTLHFSA